VSTLMDVSCTSQVASSSISESACAISLISTLDRGLSCLVSSSDSGSCLWG
jgi:hypothetical protein